MNRVFWIDIGYACFGILASGTLIVDCAPIANWMHGKTLAEIKPWLINKKAKVKEII